MKRNAALIALSRDHHTALSLALRARRAAADANPGAAEAMARALFQRFHEELLPHFKAEENWLLPRLAAAGEDALAARTLAEHGELKQLAAALSTGGKEALIPFADSLTAHVRFEERELFPAAESHPGLLDGIPIP